MLDRLVRGYIENYDENQSYEIYKFFQSLIDETDFEQLKSELETIEKNELKEISDSVKKIKNKLKYKPEDKNFVHYTSLTTLKFCFINLITKNKILASVMRMKIILDYG